jgi:hypothetical protein
MIGRTAPGGAEFDSLKSTEFSYKDVLVSAVCIIVAFFAFYLFWQDLNGVLNRQLEPVGTITYKHRSAQRRFGDRVLWTRLRRDLPVYDGDFIRTAEFSELRISFSGGQEINLAENSLVRIYIKDDRVLIDLGGGSVSVVASSDPGSTGRGLSLVLGNDRIDLDSGTVADFQVLEAGFNIQVTEGAILVNSAVTPNTETQPERFGSGAVLSLDSGAVSQRTDPSVVVLSPRPAVEYSAGEAAAPVEFTWTTANYTEQEKTRLEIALDRRFTRPVMVLDAEDTSAVTSLPPGTFWWRAYPVSAAGLPLSPLEEAVIGKITILPDPAAAAPAAASVVAQPSIPEPVAAEPPIVVLPPPPRTETLVPVAAPPAPVVRRTPEPTAPAPAGKRDFPPDNFVIDAGYVRESRSINFVWEQPAGQASPLYIFTLYKESPSGRQTILQTGPNADTSYTLDDIQRIGDGSFVWQIEVVSLTDGVEQQKTTLENRFTIDIPKPRVPQVRTGIRYGQD